MTASGRGALKALLVDDHPLVLNALTTALTSLQTFDCIDRDQTLSQAMKRLERASDYDLILLDLHMSDAAGAEAVVRLREAHPDMPVVIFSGDEAIETIQAAFDHGALGYIPKRTPVPQIINAIKIVLDGGSYIPPDFMRALGFEPPETRRRARPSEPAVPKLTPRQEEVFAYLLQGMPNKIIADRLGMAEGTVKAHLFTIFRLFGANSRTQLILKASQLGLI